MARRSSCATGLRALLRLARVHHLAQRAARRGRGRTTASSSSTRPHPHGHREREARARLEVARASASSPATHHARRGRDLQRRRRHVHPGPGPPFSTRVDPSTSSTSASTRPGRSDDAAPFNLYLRCSTSTTTPTPRGVNTTTTSPSPTWSRGSPSSPTSASAWSTDMSTLRALGLGALLPSAAAASSTPPGTSKTFRVLGVQVTNASRASDPDGRSRPARRPPRSPPDDPTPGRAVTIVWLLLPADRARGQHLRLRRRPTTSAAHRAHGDADGAADGGVRRRPPGRSRIQALAFACAGGTPGFDPNTRLPTCNGAGARVDHRRPPDHHPHARDRGDEPRPELTEVVFWGAILTNPVVLREGDVRARVSRSALATVPRPPDPELRVSPERNRRCSTSARAARGRPPGNQFGFFCAASAMGAGPSDASGRGRNWTAPSSTPPSARAARPQSGRRPHRAGRRRFVFNARGRRARRLRRPPLAHSGVVTHRREPRAESSKLARLPAPPSRTLHDITSPAGGAAERLARALTPRPDHPRCAGRGARGRGRCGGLAPEPWMLSSRRATPRAA